MATYTWLENLSKTNPYKVYSDLDIEDFIVEEYDNVAKSGTGAPNHIFDNEALMNKENQMDE